MATTEYYTFHPRLIERYYFCGSFSLCVAGAVRYKTLETDYDIFIAMYKKKPLVQVRRAYEKTLIAYDTNKKFTSARLFFLFYTKADKRYLPILYW